MFTNRFTLNSIWDKQVISEHIMKSYNEVINIDESIQPISLKEAWAVQMVIYQYCHTLRNGYMKYFSEDKDVALEDVKEIISHNVIPLVNEIRMLVKTTKFNEVGKLHNQTTTRPYNNDGQVDNIVLDNIVYTDLTSMTNAIDFIKKNSTYLKMIYKELTTIIQMIY